jgi:hypothetical protein
MDILKQLPELEPYFFEEGFIHTLESHLTHLRNTNVQFKTIDDHLLDKYAGDFYGLLDELGIGKQYHYAVMRVNGLNNSDNYRSTMTAIVLPDFSEIESIKDIYRTKK